MQNKRGGARSVVGRWRRLTVEALETRRVLDAAAPWHNDALPLDVNHDGVVVPIDALAIINRLLVAPAGTLAAPVGSVDYYYDTTGDNVLSPQDALRVINRLLTPPEVTLDPLMPFTIDLTPRLFVNASGPMPIPDGTPVHLDVDLNNDGSFSGNELNYTETKLFEGHANFALAPALPPDVGTDTYSIKLRARLADSEGVQGASTVQPLVVDTQTSNALYDYVNTPDSSYHYSLVGSADGPGYTYYVLSMTSQTWHEGDVNDPVWDHWLRIVVPDGAVSSTAMLLIDGGSNTSGQPGAPSSTDPLVLTALATGAVTANLKIVPNEDVYFFAEDPIRYRGEDEIISYTLNQFLEDPTAPDANTWPLLLPMVKSAVRAMDTIQSYVPTVDGNQSIDDFVVTGYSKRGWTTWLTAAADDRVRAIIPGVFDNLNQGPQMVHHYEDYGFFSREVIDYSDENIFQRIQTPEAELLSRITDPYRYLTNGRFDDMPKLVLNGSGDEFFVTDSSQFYFDDLPGQNNYLRYFPNAGHPLKDYNDGSGGNNDTRALESTITFVDAVINNRPLPKFSWTDNYDNSITVHTVDTPSKVLLWQATNPVSRDFRDYGGQLGPRWTSTELVDQGGGVYVGDVPTPDDGATAYLIEMTFPSAIPGMSYVFTTDARIASHLPWAAWEEPLIQEPDFPSGAVSTQAAPAVALASDSDNAQTPIFALPGSPAGTSSAAATPVGTTAATDVRVASATATAAALADSAAYEPDAADEVDLSGITTDDAVDSVFDEDLDELLA